MEIAGLSAHIRDCSNMWTKFSPVGLRNQLSSTESLDGPVLFTLLRLALTKASGRMEWVLSSGETLEGTLIQGNIQSLKSFSQHDNEVIAGILREKKDMDEDDILEATNTANSQKFNLVRFLMGKGDIGPHDAVRLFRQVFFHHIRTLLQSTSGSLLFTVKEAGKMAPGPVPTPTLGMISLWLHLYLSNIDSSEKSLVAQGLFSQSLKVEKSSLKWMEKWGWKLDLDPRFLTDLSSSGVPWQEIQRIHGKSATEDLLLAAWILGKVETEEDLSDTALNPAPQKEVEFLASLRKKDLFERLDLHWTCHSKDITESYARRVRNIEENLTSENLSAGRELLKESRKVLGNQETRLEYRNETYGLRLIRERCSFITDQARRCILRKEWVQAIESLEAVVEMGIRTAEVLELLDIAQEQSRKIG